MYTPIWMTEINQTYHRNYEVINYLGGSVIASNQTRK